MTVKFSWPNVLLALYLVASITTLLDTVGAPQVDGGLSVLSNR
jgi:hypothetical protein